MLIALTGWGQERDKDKAREAGFDHHLVKPAKAEDLRVLLSGARRRSA
jgi:DNA-binding response OmpR family regulator